MGRVMAVSRRETPSSKEKERGGKEGSGGKVAIDWGLEELRGRLRFFLGVGAGSSGTATITLADIVEGERGEGEGIRSVGSWCGRQCGDELMEGLGGR